MQILKDMQQERKGDSVLDLLEKDAD